MSIILTNQKCKNLPFLRWLPRVFTNDPPLLGWVTKEKLVVLYLSFCFRDLLVWVPM